MGCSRILSDAQIDEMATLRESGRSIARIVEHFERGGLAVSRGAIGWQCLRLGIETSPERRRPLNGPAFGSGRGFTPDEDARLLALEAGGARIVDIARVLGRGTSSIVGRLSTLARIEARAEAEDP